MIYKVRGFNNPIYEARSMGARWFIFSVKSFKSKIIFFLDLDLNRATLSQFFDLNGFTLYMYLKVSWCHQ